MIVDIIQSSMDNCNFSIESLRIAGYVNMFIKFLGTIRGPTDQLLFMQKLTKSK